MIASDDCGSYFNNFLRYILLVLDIIWLCNDGGNEGFLLVVFSKHLGAHRNSLILRELDCFLLIEAHVCYSVLFLIAHLDDFLFPFNIILLLLPRYMHPLTSESSESSV